MQQEQVDLSSWDEFECEARALCGRHPAQGELIFRGLGDASWPLTTTLERHDAVEMAFAMERLDDYNVNAFSLFESNEALLETIALRRLVFQPEKQRRHEVNETARFAADADDAGEIDG